MMEETVAFGEIDDIDLNRVSKFARVLHPKVEPLQVSVSIRVITHPTVICSGILQSDLV